MLASELRVRGYEVVTTREPGGTSLGLRLREALLDIEQQVDPLAELLLYAADRAQHVRALVIPALESGHIVLSDRYADATVAYQGGGRGFSPLLISEVIALATDGLQPHLTLLFDLPIEEGRRRASQRMHRHGEANDRLDLEDAEFHRRVREAYLRIAEAEPDRVRVVDSRASAEETHAAVMDIVMSSLDLRF